MELMPDRKLKVKNQKSKGFSLVELLVTISIMAVLSVIGITAYSGIQSRSRDAIRLEDARRLVLAIEQYRSSAGRYPGASCTTINPYCSSQNLNWIPDITASNFRDGIFPSDPLQKNCNVISSPELCYYYATNATGSDYCLQISQENNVSGNPYLSHKYTSCGSKLGCWNGVWKLRFGPYGANGNNSEGTSSICKDWAL